MNDLIPATGAYPSQYDTRTFIHDTDVAFSGVPIVGKGGIIYEPRDIGMQAKVGICTAISVVQNAEKYHGKNYSPDFHWLLQKTLVDHNWYEGSQIINSLKVGKNFGFLPIELWTYTTQSDRQNYDKYTAKLKAIPQSEIDRLKSLCVNKLVGYASLKTDPQSIAQGILDSKCGLITMLQSGSTWWTRKDGVNSWRSVDIDPIRRPTESLSGHAIIASYFDYSVTNMVTFANTWSTDWNDTNFGNCHIDLNIQRLYEAWIPYYEEIPLLTQTQLDDLQNQVTQAQLTLVGILKLFVEWLKNKKSV